MLRTLRIAAAVALLAAGSAFAFKWDPNAFPAGSHSYTWELTVDQGDGPQTATVQIDIVKKGDTYDTTTTTTVTQKGVSQGDLSGAALGGSMMGTFALGPMTVFYGPAFMMLPALLGNEDIHVRKDPVRVAGMGDIYMDKEQTFAGFKCVVLRLQLDDGSPPVEMALADGLPFPCYSKYGDQGNETVVTLIKAK